MMMSSKEEPSEVLTFVMTVEYNGFNYSGFQRQTATNTTSSQTVSPPSSSVSRPTKKLKKNTSISTVQQQIESALEQWTSLSIATLRVRGAGRTDKGVHASGQVVAFDIPIKLLYTDNNTQSHRTNNNFIEYLREAHCSLTSCISEVNNSVYGEKVSATKTWPIRRALSTRLPSDIIIRSIRMYTGTEPFEARKKIACKTYTFKLRYRELTYISNDGSIEDKQEIHPICNAGPHILRRVDDHNAVWLSLWPLDTELLQKACSALVGRHDFVNFVHKEDRKKTDTADGSDHVIDLFEFKVETKSEIEEDDPSLPLVMNAKFTLKAKGFHRYMVRNLVGFVVDAARGERSVDDVSVLLLEKQLADVDYSSGSSTDLASTVNAAPACGLCLANVEYEHSNFL